MPQCETTMYTYGILVFIICTQAKEKSYHHLQPPTVLTLYDREKMSMVCAMHMYLNKIQSLLVHDLNHY